MYYFDILQFVLKRINQREMAHTVLYHDLSVYDSQSDNYVNRLFIPRACANCRKKVKQF